MQGEVHKYLGQNLSADDLLIKARREKAAATENAEPATTLPFPSPFTQAAESEANARIEQARAKGVGVDAVVEAEQAAAKREWIEKEQKRLKDLRTEEDIAANTDEIHRMELLRGIESAPVTQRAPMPMDPQIDGMVETSPSSDVRMVHPSGEEIRGAGTVQTEQSAPTSSGRIATQGSRDLPPYTASVMNPEEQKEYRKAA